MKGKPSKSEAQPIPMDKDTKEPLQILQRMLALRMRANASIGGEYPRLVLQDGLT